jgi:hypothetical protein
MPIEIDPETMNLEIYRAFGHRYNGNYQKMNAFKN